MGYPGRKLGLASFRLLSNFAEGGLIKLKKYWINSLKIFGVFRRPRPARNSPVLNMDYLIQRQWFAFSNMAPIA